jgi:RNA polymerase sigma-70 factor, ECF subfamily
MSTYSSNSPDASRARRPAIGSRIVEEIAICRGPELRRIARRLTGDPDEASDLLQDTLERALCLKDTLPSKSLFGWLVTVMRNISIDRCRQRRVRLRGLHALYWCGRASPLDSDAFDEVVRASSRVTYDDVTRALEDLEPPFRKVFELYASHLTLSEIGSALGIPAATAGTRLFRARQKLRAILAHRVDVTPISGTCKPRRFVGASGGRPRWAASTSAEAAVYAEQQQKINEFGRLGGQ